GETLITENPSCPRTVLRRLQESIIISRADGEELLFEPGADGGRRWNLTRRVDAYGNGVTYLYDADDRLVSLVDFRGTRLQLSYNGAGLFSEMMLEGPLTGDARRLVAFEYDSRAFLVAAYDASGAVERYDYNDGLLVTYTNRLGGATFFAYDERRR